MECIDKKKNKSHFFLSLFKILLDIHTHTHSKLTYVLMNILNSLLKNSRTDLLKKKKQLMDRTTSTAELKLVIVGPPSSVPTTPPHPITWITATTLYCLCNKRCFEVMLFFFVPTAAHEQRENRTTLGKDDLRGTYKENMSITRENTCRDWRAAVVMFK